MTLRDDLKKLHGKPPYDGPSNVVRNDPYFARSLERKYGASIEDLERRAAGIEKSVQALIQGT